ALLFVAALAVTGPELILAPVGFLSSRAHQAAAGNLPAPGFHHLHLNSMNPDAAVAFYAREFPSTSKATWGGLPALKSPNNVLVLFTKVDQPPAAHPQTAVWHLGWHVTSERATMARLRADGVTLLPLYVSEDGAT